MSKYSMEDKYNENEKYNIADLCMEISKEYYEIKEKFHEESYFRDKFSNHDRSGVLDKLEDNLDFNVNIISNDTEKGEFEKLKLMKLLFRYEKNLYNRRNYSNKQYRVTDILSLPHMENIRTIYSDKSAYGDVFETLQKEIATAIDDADIRSQRYEKISFDWDYMIGKLFDYVISDRALEHCDDALYELTRIERYVDIRLLDKIKGANPHSVTGNDGVLKTFYNILESHRVLCDEVDRIEINYAICQEEEPSPDYIDATKRYEQIEAKWDLVDILLEAFSKKTCDKITDGAIEYIAYGKHLADLTDTEIKDYIYALKKVKKIGIYVGTVMKLDFSETIYFTTLALLIQEIVAVKKDKTKIENRYWGYTNKLKPLLYAVKNPEKADAKVIATWIVRIQNRCAVNYGARKLIEKKRELENKLLLLKEFIFSYYSLEDVNRVNDLLFHFASRDLLARSASMEKGGEFGDKIYPYLHAPFKDRIKILMFDNGINVMSMFWEFMVDESDAEDRVAREIADDINNFYENTRFSIIEKSFWVEFQTISQYEVKRNFMVEFSINRCNNQMEWLQFFEVSSDEETEKLKELGLGKFVRG